MKATNNRNLIACKDCRTVKVIDSVGIDGAKVFCKVCNATTEVLAI